ncbi:MAG TPA: hypothetical protein VN931_07695 [Fibrobacteria bacterium]|nr:hypothetical protein [Fibrobacteria bacterium]
MAKDFEHGRDRLPLREVAGQVESYRRQAEELGRMQVGRPLLECPSCGLYEDELADLRFMVCAEDKPGVDTGLRFLPMDGGDTWMCPACHGVVGLQTGSDPFSAT